MYCRICGYRVTKPGQPCKYCGDVIGKSEPTSVTGRFLSRPVIQTPPVQIGLDRVLRPRLDAVDKIDTTCFKDLVTRPYALQHYAVNQNARGVTDVYHYYDPEDCTFVTREMDAKGSVICETRRPIEDVTYEHKAASR